MKLRERVAHLEKWYEKQETIEALKAAVQHLEKELSAIKDYFGIEIETYKVMVIKKERRQENDTCET